MNPLQSDEYEIEAEDIPWVTIKIENGIIYAIYKKGVTIDLVAAKEITQSRMRVLRDRRFPGFADIRHVKLVTQEARRYLAKEQATNSFGITAIALQVGSRLTVITANLFIRLSNQKFPPGFYDEGACAEMA